MQGELDRALASLGDDRVRTTFAGRTDRGVHAIGQVVATSLCTLAGFAGAPATSVGCEIAATILRRCRSRPANRNSIRDLTRNGESIVIASRSVSQIRSLPVTPAFCGANWTSMSQRRRPGDYIGRHDFATFASGGQGVPTSRRVSERRGTTRTIFRCECREIALNTIASVDVPTRLFELRVVADGFLPQMVRNIVGALIEIGQRRRDRTGSTSWSPRVTAASDPRRTCPRAHAVAGRLRQRCD